MKTNWASIISDLNGAGLSDSDIAARLGVKKFGASAVKQLRSKRKKATKSPRYEAGKGLLELHALLCEKAA